MSGGLLIEERRAALELASAALDRVDEQLWEVQGADLAPLMELVDRLGRQVEAARVAVLAEATERGEVGGGSPGAQRWLREHAPSTRYAGCARTVSLVEHVRLPRYAALRREVLAAWVRVRHAAVVVDAFARLRLRLHPLAHEPVLEALTELAGSHGPREVRGIRRHLVARYGGEGEFQGGQDALRRRATLSQGVDDGSGLYEYRVVADAEGHAVLEAAIAALAAPRPSDGEPDLRPAGQRRFEALVEVVRRGVAGAAGIPSTPKAELFVSMDLEDLRRRLDAGTVVGSPDAGSLLGPETVRRLACDAGIVPVVLGQDGELLELGRRHRLFTAPQVRALWLRDGHCSFPGCSVPASWCDAHHLWHWCDGGPTDLANAALLCGHHHQVVHARGYWGQVQDGHVVWERVTGAYHAWLAQRMRPSADRSAGAGDSDRRP
jgi:hypothetical protein